MSTAQALNDNPAPARQRSGEEMHIEAYSTLSDVAFAELVRIFQVLDGLSLQLRRKSVKRLLQNLNLSPRGRLGREISSCFKMRRSGRNVEERIGRFVSAGSFALKAMTART